MTPLRLTDDELTAVFQAARPLAPYQRDSFLQEVASELARAGEVGPGTVNRAVRAVQKRFFDPPELGHRDYAKYR